MFVRRTVQCRDRVAAVFTDEVHDFGSVKRSTLAVRVPMTTAAQTQVEDTKEDVHDSPVSAARSQSCNLPDCALRVNGRSLRNTLAVQRPHFRPVTAGPCGKVFLPESKSFHVLSSFPANYRLLPIALSQLRNQSPFVRRRRLTFVSAADDPCRDFQHCSPAVGADLAPQALWVGKEVSCCVRH